jgi:enediyne polyketide synthase
MPIAIVSFACRYPDADTPDALWRNVLEGRRSFRMIPPGRLDLAQYAADIIGEADSITRVRAGLLADWQFNCARFRIPHSTFAAADLSHWLALEVAAEAIARAGGAAGLNPARTAVVVANTLTGEFSRAAMLRLRSPFLDALLADAANASGIDEGQSTELRRRFLAALRNCFPAPQEETLAGGLANTIAGRVANYFDLAGGAYSVDAACASSLVALAHAADLLSLDAVDAVVVGAVDISLDPFELIGFSRNGALAKDDMRVFDRDSSGFWPGEGAAFAVLMRESDACRRQRPVCAVIRGWGISTDGAGGFTRPSVEGQVLALRRAYERAAVDPEHVGYIEAHGTGTAVGDPAEVRALATMRNGASRPLPIGSIKANIGHTKAAAGFAGLIKSISALEHGFIPPHVGCIAPHPVFREVDDRVRPALAPEMWPDGARIAGVSAFGFGGINAHVVLERNGAGKRASVLPSPPRRQDAELFVFAGGQADVTTTINTLAARAPTLSLGEFVDAAAYLAGLVRGGPVRVAITASQPEELAAKLAQAAAAVLSSSELMDFEQGICVTSRRAVRLGFLFTGQAAPSRPQGGCWVRRFDSVRTLLAAMPASPDADATDTRIAQPAIAAASLAATRILQDCGIEAAVSCGHSLGELTALAWAGALATHDLIALAAARGATMAAHGRSGGGMLRIAASAPDVHHLIDGLALAIACLNGPLETVVSGPQADIARALERARRAELETTRLAVSHAFHSTMMEPAVAPFVEVLRGYRFGPVVRRVLSTVAGKILTRNDDLQALLARQFVAPVRFDECLRLMTAEADFLIEVGSGSGLTRLARQAGHTAMSVDAFADTLAPLLTVVGAAFATGQPVNLNPLFQDRAIRPIDLNGFPQLLRNPCGRSSSEPAIEPMPIILTNSPSSAPNGSAEPAPVDQRDIDTVLRQVLSEETGFAPADIGNNDRFLDDLHLNSIAVARIVTKAARLSGIRIPDSPTEFANATIAELVVGLTALGGLDTAVPRPVERTTGVRPWVRTFAVQWSERAPANRAKREIRWKASAIQAGEDDNILAGQFHTAGEVDGLLIWLGSNADHRSTRELFAACRAARSAGIANLAICHAGYPVSAFARSLAIEQQFQSVLVIERPTHGDVRDRIRQELNSRVEGFYEIRIDSNGVCFEPHFNVIAPEPERDDPPGADDVVLVTGGAKGIGAECALRLAERTGATIILVGRSVESNPAVAATLDRAKAAGVRCRYANADVTDTQALAAAVTHAARELGPVTMLVHAAGMNEPKLFQDIDDADLARTMAPKTIGFHAAVQAAGPRLRRIVTFGSILGRMGLKGETHYAIANAWQSVLADEIARTRPTCRVLSLEWSIWNGAGMGHRLGSLEGLARFGVDAIALDDGIDAFERLVVGGATGAIMVTSRFGPPSYVSLGEAEVPPLRFVDKILLHYPKLEIVIETELSRGRDLYLTDHCVDGQAVFPGAAGLEAMAQVAWLLAGQVSPIAVEAVTFRQAIVVPQNGHVTLRISALVGLDGRVEAVIRSDDDAFATDRMRATFSHGAAVPLDAPEPVSENVADTIDAAPLYGSLFFQGDRFRRIGKYSVLSARRIAASLLPPDRRDWFSPFEPQRLVLGDLGARDALLHALQAAVPHLRVVPISVETIALRPDRLPIKVVANERRATADTFVFDIFAYDAAGLVVECWRGATFRAIGEIAIDDVVAATPAIAGPYMERIARAITNDDSIEVALVCNPDLDIDERRRRALAALALDGCVFTRGDGRPIIIGGNGQGHLSIAHSNDATLAVKADNEVGCDIEAVPTGPESGATAHLSPSARTLFAQLMASGAEPHPVAATRVWTVREVATKQSRQIELPCRIQRHRRSEVVAFESAFGRTATIYISGPAQSIIVAVGTSTELGGRSKGPEVAADHRAPVLEEQT